MPNPTGKGGWRPGQSGNLKGRPKKGLTLSDILQKHAKKKDVKDGENYITRKEALAKKLWALALSGDIAAIKYIYDRIDGRPDQKQAIEMELSGAEAIVSILNEAYERRRKKSD